MIEKRHGTGPGRWLLPALVSLALAAPVRAQTPVELRPGDRLRIQIDTSPPRTGELIQLAPDTIVLALPGRPEVIVHVPRTSVTRAWVSAGRYRGPGRDLLVGSAAVGAAFGGLIGGIASTICLGDGCSNPVDPVAVVAGAAVGAGAAFAVGALIGFATRHERWQQVELRPRAVAAPAGGGRLGLGVRLAL